MTGPDHTLAAAAADRAHRAVLVRGPAALGVAGSARAGRGTAVVAAVAVPAYRGVLVHHRPAVVGVAGLARSRSGPAAAVAVGTARRNVRRPAALVVDADLGGQ